ncbi:MAG: hypothetical protein AB4372_32350 [Xenococcus sp. (in: cyanobacteria)]
MTKKKMGSMTSLSKLSGIKAKSNESSDTVTPEPEVKPSEDKPVKEDETKAKVNKQQKKQEQPVTVNIKIRKDQKAWLTDTAIQVRENNSEPVAPAERVYPQHLIGVAIDLLQAADVDWDEVRNIEELREHLNL